MVRTSFPNVLIFNPRFSRDVYGVRIYPRVGFLRSGSIKPHRSVRFVAADIRSVTVRDFSQKRISAPLRTSLEKSAPPRDIFKGGYSLRNNP